MIAYKELLIEKKKEQPFWKKKCLSVNETAAIQVSEGENTRADESERL